MRFDWPRQFYSRRRFFDGMFRELDEMMREMEREFEDVEIWTSEDFVREYTTPRGRKVREVGPMVYGYSMTIGYDGKPKVREFGNVKPSRRFGGSMRPEISGKTGTEYLVDVITTAKEVKAIMQIPVVSKDKIKIYAYDNTVEVKSKEPQRRHHHTFEIPSEADTETAKSTYNNGILEITFKKKSQIKTKGKTIKMNNISNL